MGHLQSVLMTRLIIPTTWEVEVGERQVQVLPRLQSEFKTSLGSLVRPRLRKEKGICEALGSIPSTTNNNCIFQPLSFIWHFTPPVVSCC